ncbi:parvo_NS1 domain-containing protein [Trichonephila clavipes]|uniref:Parvo_NS1 domain-containing protein n=1 Tax=Trichonephila clavipes TaxID=2585209 RepID=A0A8X6SLW2_TRICX|nr:parvo_NS1 domain-containing protein [Trichonephila clavipes]
MHVPGYRYCGPGTDVAKQDQAGGPVNELDRLCRKHDIEVSTLGAKEADRRFNEAAPKVSWLGNFFSGLIAAKGNLRGLPGSQYQPGEGDPSEPNKIPQETPPQKPQPVKRPHTPQKINPYEQAGPAQKHIKKDLSRDVELGREMPPQPKSSRADPAKKGIPVSTGGTQPEITVPLTNLHTGGAVGPKVSFGTFPPCQTFIDKGYILPVSDNLRLPNNDMNIPIGNQKDTTLCKITWKAASFLPHWNDTSFMYYYTGGIVPPIALEYSNEFENIPPNGIFSFEHTFQPHELQWRSGLYPNNSDASNNPYWAANPLGRWDGGIGFDGLSATNYRRLNSHV